MNTEGNDSLLFSITPEILSDPQGRGRRAVVHVTATFVGAVEDGAYLDNPEQEAIIRGLRAMVRALEQEELDRMPGPRMGEIHPGTPCFDGGVEAKP